MIALSSFYFTQFPLYYQLFSNLLFLMSNKTSIPLKTVVKKYLLHSRSHSGDNQPDFSIDITMVNGYDDEIDQNQGTNTSDDGGFNLESKQRAAYATRITWINSFDGKRDSYDTFVKECESAFKGADKIQTHSLLQCLQNFTKIECFTGDSKP